MNYITQAQYNHAMKVAERNQGGGRGDTDVGRTMYVVFGDYGLSLNYPKKYKNEVRLLGKWVPDWKNKTVREINAELSAQPWK